MSARLRIGDSGGINPRGFNPNWRSAKLFLASEACGQRRRKGHVRISELFAIAQASARFEPRRGAAARNDIFMKDSH
jgi:hypothetical protein